MNVIVWENFQKHMLIVKTTLCGQKKHRVSIGVIYVCVLVYVSLCVSVYLN